MKAVIPHRDNLEELAKAYLDHLTHRNEAALKKYLSLNFLTRQKVTEQLRLIENLPNLLCGIDIEIHLFAQYVQSKKNGNLRISPFQFEVSYTPLMNLVEIEKMTITIHAVTLEEGRWKIESIINNEEQDILTNMVREMREKTRTVGK